MMGKRLPIRSSNAAPGFFGATEPPPQPTAAPVRKPQLEVCPECGGQVERLTGICNGCRRYAAQPNAWAHRWDQEGTFSNDPERLAEIMEQAAHAHDGFIWAELLVCGANAIRRLLPKGRRPITR
jgi:hypothetical protein